MFHFAICHKTQRESNNNKQSLIQIREKKRNTNFSLKKMSNNFLFSKRKHGEGKKKYWNKFEILSFDGKKKKINFSASKTILNAGIGRRK